MHWPGHSFTLQIFTTYCHLRTVCLTGRIYPGTHGYQCHFDISLNRLPVRSWHHRPGHPRIKWSAQLWDIPYKKHTWRSVEECYSPWSPWWSDATALAGYTTADDNELIRHLRRVECCDKHVCCTSVLYHKHVSETTHSDITNLFVHVACSHG